MHHSGISIATVLFVSFRVISLMFDGSSVISEEKHRCDIVFRRSRQFGVKFLSFFFSL